MTTVKYISLDNLTTYNTKLKAKYGASLKVDNESKKLQLISGSGVVLTELSLSTLADIQLATSTLDGLMSKEDKAKLDSYPKAFEDADAALKTEIEAAYKAADTALKTEITTAYEAADTALGARIDAVEAKLVGGVHYKGSVEAYDNLPTNAEQGDMYNIVAADDTHNVKAGDNAVWTGEAWDILAGVIQIEAVADSDIEALFS